MSKKHDAFTQVRLTPDNIQKLRDLSARHPLKPSLVALVNGIIRTWPASDIGPASLVKDMAAAEILNHDR